VNDFLNDCISDLGVKNDPRAFMETFCARCRNRECVNAKWAGDKFAARVATQPDRLFRPNVADPANPKYARLADFVDNLREAMRLEIADRRKDWEIPEIPILDGTERHAPPATTAPLDGAARALAQARGRDLNLPDPWAESAKEFVLETERLMPVDDPPVVEPSVEPSVEPPPTPMVVPPPPPRYKAPPSVAVGNAPAKSGVMIGGAKPAQAPADDWEPKKKVDTVQPGARIKLGGDAGKGK